MINNKILFNSLPDLPVTIKQIKDVITKAKCSAHLCQICKKILPEELIEDLIQQLPIAAQPQAVQLLENSPNLFFDFNKFVSTLEDLYFPATNNPFLAICQLAQLKQDKKTIKEYSAEYLALLEMAKLPSAGYEQLFSDSLNPKLANALIYRGGVCSFDNMVRELDHLKSQFSTQVYSEEVLSIAEAPKSKGTAKKVAGNPSNSYELRSKSSPNKALSSYLCLSFDISSLDNSFSLTN